MFVIEPTPEGHQAGCLSVSRSKVELFCSHLRTNLRKSCSSSRHMDSRLVGDPLANRSGKLETITLVPPVPPLPLLDTGVILINDLNENNHIFYFNLLYVGWCFASEIITY